MISQANLQQPLNGNKIFSAKDEHWMQYALSLARQAESQNEVPIGAVLISEDKVVGEGFNSPIQLNDPTAHAEIIALRNAASNLRNYRLVNTTLYVTLEPCLMCVGAIVHARVERLVFGAFDLRAGAICSAFDVFAEKKLNHHVICEGGLLVEECGKLLTNFFKGKR